MQNLVSQNSLFLLMRIYHLKTRLTDFHFILICALNTCFPNLENAKTPVCAGTENHFELVVFLDTAVDMFRK